MQPHQLQQLLRDDMIFFEIPLTPDSADQTFDLTIEDVPYSFRVLWNERFQYFSLSISEKGGEEIITNVKMVAGYPLIRSEYLFPFSGNLYFLHRGGKTYRPTFDDIGKDTYGLFYYDDEIPVIYPFPLVPEI